MEQRWRKDITAHSPPSPPLPTREIDETPSSACSWDELETVALGLDCAVLWKPKGNQLQRVTKVQDGVCAMPEHPQIALNCVMDQCHDDV